MARALLQPVEARQTRFRLQGLVPDARGIATGREMLVIFDTFDRLVAFLGAYSDEASLDALMSSLTIERYRRQGGGRGFLLRCAASEGYEVDRVDRIAATVQGRVFTGAGSIFVQWRDHKAPFGYDLVVRPSEFGTLATSDVLAIERNSYLRYHEAEPIDPTELILRIDLRRTPLPRGGLSAAEEDIGVSEHALVLVAPGISDRVVSYLWRRQVPMGGTRLRLEGDRRASLLLRLRRPDPALLDVLYPIPGVEVLRLVSPRAAVELGWSHPINLASVTESLPANDLCLWRGQAGRVERLDGAPRWIEGRHLVATEVDFQPEAPTDVALERVQALRFELRLKATAHPREARGCLVPWDQLETLRKVMYVLPPSVLATARMVPLHEGILVLAGGFAASIHIHRGRSDRGEGAHLRSDLFAASLLPIGRRLCEAAPGVLVPDGVDLRPRLRPDLIRSVLGLEDDDYAVFLEVDQPPLRIRAEQVSPLDAAVVGRVSARSPEMQEFELPALSSAKVENTRLGRFALWGFRGGQS